MGFLPVVLEEQTRTDKSVWPSATANKSSMMTLGFIMGQPLSCPARVSSGLHLAPQCKAQQARVGIGLSQASRARLRKTDTPSTTSEDKSFWKISRVLSGFFSLGICACILFVAVS